MGALFVFVDLLSLTLWSQVVCIAVMVGMSLSAL